MPRQARLFVPIALMSALIVAFASLPGCGGSEVETATVVQPVEAAPAEEAAPQAQTLAMGKTGEAPVMVEAAAPEATPEPAPEPLTVVQRSVSDGVVVANLSNGLTVILKATRTAPVVCVRGYIRAGGLYEKEWLGCGLSHLLEHLVADDATHDSQGGGSYELKKEAGNRVTRIGGQANAYTTLDHTCYYISAGAGKSGECIDLIADWLARPKFTSEDFEREHGVVQRELEKGKDEPSRQAWYAHAQNVYGTHPAAVPVIGFAEPLRNVTWEDISAYHARMYVPQNMIFVVVGDIDVEESLLRAQKAFAGFESGRRPDLSLPEARPFTGVRTVARKQEGMKDVSVAVSFQSIPLLHEDLYALDVLGNVLAAGRSSRLHREIFRKQKLVTTISCSSWTPQWGTGTFTFRYRCEPDKEQKAREALLAELRKVVAEGVGADEVLRAQRQMVAGHVYSQQTVETVASSLGGDFRATGDVLFSKHYTDRIQAVTVEQVNEMARKYLTFDRMVITRLSGELKAQSVASEEADAKQKARVLNLANGVRVILQPSDAADLVAMTYVVTGGVLTETPETNGLGTLMAALSTRGSTHYTSKQIDAFFANAGGGMSGNCGNNSFYWNASVLADNFYEALDVFAEAITEPTFDPAELEIIRPALLAGIRRKDENWSSQLSKFYREKFFKDSTYGMLSIGKEEVVEKATIEQIRERHQRLVLGGNGVLAIYGKFDPDTVTMELEELFGQHQCGSDGSELVGAAQRKIPAEGEWHTLKTDKKQAGVTVAMPGMRVLDLEDRFATAVLDTIISGYRLPSGWLHNELRGKQLVYVVHANNWSGLNPGAFVTYAACQPEKAKEVVEIIQRNLRKAVTYTPTQQEVDLAVNAILTADILGNQKLSDLAMEAALDEIYGLGYDFRRSLEERYRAVTPEDVRRVAEKYLSGGFFVAVTTPKPELLEVATPDEAEGAGSDE
jgi:zinc protease